MTVPLSVLERDFSSIINSQAHMLMLICLCSFSERKEIELAALICLYTKLPRTHLGINIDKK